MEDFSPDTQPLGTVVQRRMPTARRTGDAPRERLEAMIRAQRAGTLGEDAWPSGSPEQETREPGMPGRGVPGPEAPGPPGLRRGALGCGVLGRGVLGHSDAVDEVTPPVDSDHEETWSGDSSSGGQPLEEPGRARNRFDDLRSRRWDPQDEETNPAARPTPWPEEVRVPEARHRSERAAPWRFSTARRAVLGVLVLAVLAAVVLLVFFPRSSDENAGVLSAPAASAPASAAPSASGASGGASSGTGGEVVVHVVGAVRKPGLYRLPQGAVLDDARHAAGGATGDAAVDAVNLAQPLPSGQQLRMPTRQEAASGKASSVLSSGEGTGADTGGTEEAPAAGGASATAGSGTGSSQGTSGADGAGEAGASGGTTNLNTATAAELEELPRVGPVLAQRIVEYRQQNGPFSSPQDLDAVPGIGPAMMAALEPLVST